MEWTEKEMEGERDREEVKCYDRNKKSNKEEDWSGILECRESPVDLWPWMTSFWWFSNCWKLVLIWQVSFAKASMCVLVAQSCPTFCDSMDCSLPNSSVHGILQVRILECVAFSRGSLWPRDGTRVPRIVSRFFTICHQGSPFTMVI